jgi:hypothetical protein
MIAAAPALQQRIPHLVIDAAIGRQMWQVPAVVRALRQSGRLGNVVVLGIGSNGPVTGRQLKEVLHQVGPTHKLVLVNTYVPLSWEHQVNALMARTARADGRVFLVDWHDAAATHTSLLYSDGVHPMPAGALIYANLVKAAVRQAEHLTHHPRPHPH